jgi:hypothetical protein
MLLLSSACRCLYVVASSAIAAAFKRTPPLPFFVLNLRFGDRAPHVFTRAFGSFRSARSDGFK